MSNLSKAEKKAIERKTMERTKTYLPTIREYSFESSLTWLSFSQRFQYFCCKNEGIGSYVPEWTTERKVEQGYSRKRSSVTADQLLFFIE